MNTFDRCKFFFKKYSPIQVVYEYSQLLTTEQCARQYAYLKSPKDSEFLSHYKIGLQKFSDMTQFSNKDRALCLEAFSDKCLKPIVESEEPKVLKVLDDKDNVLKEFILPNDGKDAKANWIVMKRAINYINENGGGVMLMPDNCFFDGG